MTRHARRVSKHPSSRLQRMRRTPYSLVGLVIAVATISACDGRDFPTFGSIGQPAVNILADTGIYDLKQVDSVNLPHVTTQAGTVYSLVSGTFQLHGDSTWLFSTLE